MKRSWLIEILFALAIVSALIAARGCTQVVTGEEIRALPPPVQYRVTLYDGGHPIDAWIVPNWHQSNSGAFHLTLPNGSSVWIQGTVIIEQQPAPTLTR